jgi:hypothetical protein
MVRMARIPSYSISSVCLHRLAVQSNGNDVVRIRLCESTMAGPISLAVTGFAK